MEEVIYKIPSTVVEVVLDKKCMIEKDRWRFHYKGEFRESTCERVRFYAESPTEALSFIDNWNEIFSLNLQYK